MNSSDPDHSNQLLIHFLYIKSTIYILMSVTRLSLNVLLVTCTLVLFSPLMCLAETLAVTAENVNLRSGPGTTYEVKWEYGKGFPVKVLKRNGNWVKITDFERDTGWIHSSLLSKVPHVIVNVNKRSKKPINIRSGPSTKYSIVGKAHYGVVFERVERKAGWSKVLHESGLKGWIKDTLLWSGS